MLALISLTLCSVLALSSCDLFNFNKEEEVVDDGSNAPKPEFKFETAKKNLTGEGYYVEVYYEFDCYSATAASLYAENDDGEELYIYEFVDKEMARLFFEYIKAKVDSSYNDDKHNLEINNYLKENYKRDFSDSEFDSLKEEIKELEKSIEDYEKGDYVVGRDGVFVWLGHREIIKDSK